MPVVSEVVHPHGFSFPTQRQIVVRRDVHKEKWADIAAKVTNLEGMTPLPRHVANTYRKFSRRQGRVRTKYAKCGRKPWKVTKEIEAYVVKRLTELRAECVCASTTLQADVARQKSVQLSTSCIRKVLQKHGYRWLPKRQKKKYTAEVRKLRLAFARKVLSWSLKQFRERLSFAMDGVVLGLPPRDPTDRLNFCRYGDDHMWRKPSEAFSPGLAGADEYAKQIPHARALPLWGGCSEGGFAAVVFHQNKKLTGPEWQRAVRTGKVVAAIKALKPAKADGPWQVLCDNESFLTAAQSIQVHANAGIQLWQIPAKSPDLNPVERFWSWLRRKLRAMDLADAIAKRPVLGKTAYTLRVKRVLKTKKAQSVAAACAKGLRKVCREVLKKKGAASSG